MPTLNVDKWRDAFSGIQEFESTNKKRQEDFNKQLDAVAAASKETKDKEKREQRRRDVMLVVLGAVLGIFAATIGQVIATLLLHYCWGIG